MRQKQEIVAPSKEWIKDMIGIDSTTYKSNEKIMHFLIPLLEETGLKIATQKVMEAGKPFYNILAYNDTLKSRNLLALHTHLDTVDFGAKKEWTQTSQNPLKATFKGDKIYGLGSADVKLDFLCKLVAIQNSRPWKRPFVLVGSYGEERGLIGTQKLFEAGLLKPKFALIGEPSNLELIYAHKGHMIFSFKISLGQAKSPIKKSWKGKAAHSSTPHLGRNAIEKALYEIKKNRWGIGKITGGVGFNIVPESCNAELSENSDTPTEQLFKLWDELKEIKKKLTAETDSRFSPNVATLSLNWAKQNGRELVLTLDIRALPNTDVWKIKKQLEKISHKLKIELTELTIDPPLKGSINSPWMKKAMSALSLSGVKKPVKETKASSTEAALYSENKAEALVFGPGISIGNVHKPNEYNSMEQIKIATRFYTEILNQEAC